ncbi:MAG: PVC-type heme-binding CxxCH protein, partial [Pirellulaceae bacterium]
QAEERVWQVARGGQDPGHARPQPEILHGVDDADIKKELASFKVPEGFQVNLFASEREGLTSPLSLRWDPAGRMYVTVTTTYPHVFPGDVPNDKIIVLEDRNQDGQADQSRVFAEGLNIPTGLEWGDGGVYVGQNTEILFLKDTNHDGRADQRRVLLGGFGNGDSHQTINSFIWSPAGELYFGQGDGCESRVETPWGASNLFQAGFYRFRPRRLQLHPLLDDFMGPGNPWGVAFDAWGQVFSVDGAGGVTYLSPGQIPSTHRLRLKTIGQPGGYCGIGYLDGRHLPASMHGDFVVGDFKSNRIKRFSVKEDGAGFSLTWKDPLLESRHRNFRPVDVKVGPDGAVYVVDWYNPITCHQDDAYRHPDRDKAHGRIWRISTTKPNTTPPDLTQAPLEQVLEALKSPEHWTRYQAKRACSARDTATVTEALDAWIQGLDPKLPRYEHHLYEALGTYATLEVVRPGLLARLLQAQDPRARAYAARIVGRWHDRLEQPLDLLAQSIRDEHPRVRMEAVMACAAIDSPRSIEIAARVVDQPLDSWIQYAFKQAVHHLQPHWLPAFKQGTVSFARPHHLAAVLNETGGRDVLASLKKLLETPDLKPPTRSAAIATILAVGGPGELKAYGLDSEQFLRAGRYDMDAHAQALGSLLAGTRFRDVRPEGDLGAALTPLILQSHPELQIQALSLAGTWKVAQAANAVSKAARNAMLPIPVRAAAFTAMVELKLPGSRQLLLNSAMPSQSLALRATAVKSLAALDMATAAGQAAALFATSNLKPAGSQSMLTAFLDRTGGAEALAAALQSRQLDPAAARKLLAALFSTGRSDQVLMVVLNQAIGTAHRTPDYNKAYVQQLVKEAQQAGQARRGRILFKTIACASCHKVGGNGGRAGPDLTAIGTTLSADRIVEELLWPNRQVKEGYSLVRVITDDGKIHQGYQRRTKESDQSGDLVLEDLAMQKTITIKQDQIDEKHVTGSVMPRGLPALLSRPQLLDLIRYLSELGKIK